jgi:hypothetical protein
MVIGKVLWSTTSACASVPSSSRVRPLALDSAPQLGTPYLTYTTIDSKISSKYSALFYFNFNFRIIIFQRFKSRSRFSTVSVSRLSIPAYID